MDTTKPFKAEVLLAELNRLRKDVRKNAADVEWLALEHAFIFLSYKMGDFQRYVEEQDAKGAFDEYKKNA